jgi:hypothetical protein
MQDLQDAGLAPSTLERIISWWKRLGGRTALMLAIGVVGPLLRYEYVPYALSSAVETVAEHYGLELTVGEWEGSLTDIKVVGKDVVIAAPGPFRESRLFRAQRVEFDWSLTRAAANGWGRLKGCWTAIFLQECTLPEEVFHRVTIDGAALHLERTMAGAWNAEAAFRPGGLGDLVSAMSRWRFPIIEGRDLSVSWVEQLRGDSGGGLLEQRFSTLDFSRVTLGVANLQLPIDDRENPTRLTFDGQTADGQISVAGSFNVARWSDVSWAPSYDLNFRLANFGAASLARFAAPDATLVPKTGTVDGSLRFAFDGERDTVCKIDLALRDVTYAPNPRSPYSRTGGPGLGQQVEPLRINETVAQDCLTPPALPLPLPQPRPLPPADPLRPNPVVPTTSRMSQRLQTMVTASALQDAPPLVRGAANYDRATVVEGRALTADEIAADVSEQLALAIGGQRGAAVARALADKDQSGNPVSRGARSLGRGIRRLFGGGNDKPTTKKPSGR